MAADCIVTISKMDGGESSRTITDASPRVTDGNYTLTVAGESSAFLRALSQCQTTEQR
jgi:hypothetical protein